jgi:hypothetical protein
MSSPEKQRPPRKVLIISPHFAPINTPDMQRTRMALPFLRKFGWEPVVLAVTPDMVEGGVLEPLLELTYPADIRVIRVGGIPPRYTRRIGFGSLWLRCGRALKKAADELLRTEHFDVVFFSTTQFDMFTLGPKWKARFGVPYVIDYQDPWVNQYYSNTRVRPPGGWLKFGYSQWCAKRREPRVLREASKKATRGSMRSASYSCPLGPRRPTLWLSGITSPPFPWSHLGTDCSTTSTPVAAALTCPWR